jgi:carbamoyl-phosphate synthase / aspartate carbamoyltransferase
MAPLQEENLMALQLKDGYICHGTSFGARKSIAGELVFQTGMVGYPESLTDPSYRGQILVITYPLVGNYGVPSRDQKDELLKDLPAYFESEQIHIAGLVVAAYAGEEFSHYLAQSSLGSWLKEQGVPAIYGVDTRALTKRIREEGSMLGKLLLSVPSPNGDYFTNGEVSTSGYATPLGNGPAPAKWTSQFETIAWVDPNLKNLVAEGE